VFNGSLGSGTITNNGSIGIPAPARRAARPSTTVTASRAASFSAIPPRRARRRSTISTLEFSGNSTAASATIINSCCLAFSGSATAGNATIVNYATGNIDFRETATAGAASITNAGYVRFMDTASGGTASYVGQAGSTVDFSYMTACPAPRSARSPGRAP
jgi:hypothetical protein